MTDMKRREFIQQAIQQTAVISTTAVSYSRVVGANERVNIGLVGCGGRGRQVAALMRQVPGAEYGAVCDVYEPNAREAQAWAGTMASKFGDFRKLLEQKSVDAVHIATPDHWHAAITVLACQAGKDVYVEKPLAHNVREGRVMVEAARRSGRIVQTGTQHRSSPHYREVQRIIQSGELGEVRFVRVWNYSNITPNGIGKPLDEPVPEGLDWDFYLGPAPKVPFNRARFLSTFRHGRQVHAERRRRCAGYVAGDIRIPASTERQLHPQLRKQQPERAWRGRANTGNELLRDARRG
jgi:hypothetical protein